MKPLLWSALAISFSSAAWAERIPGQATLDRILGESSYTVTRVQRDELGYTHVRAQQLHNGVPVYGGEVIVHLKSNGQLHYVSDNSLKVGLQCARPLRSNQELSTRARLDATWTFGVAPGQIHSEETMVVRHNGQDRTARIVEFAGLVVGRRRVIPVVFVDAQTGEAFARYDRMKHGTGTSFYEGTVTLPQTLVYNGLTHLENTTYKFGVFDGQYALVGGARFTSPSGSFTTTNQRAGVDLYLNAFRTELYYLNAHGFHIIDGAGGPGKYTSANGVRLNTLRAHDADAMNAYWDSQEDIASFGDGSLPSHGPFTALDIVAHELTHGVIHYTSNLGAMDQTQALEESIADVFAAMTEISVFGDNPAVWTVGEKVVTPYTPGGALRSFDNPELFGGIDHYSEWTLQTEVHDGAGIGNKAFAMVAHGGTIPNSGGQTVTGGIGTRKAELIWFRAVRYGLTLSGRFPDMRRETTQAAMDLYGRYSPEVTWVKKVWNDYVGVPYL